MTAQPWFMRGTDATDNTGPISGSAEGIGGLAGAVQQISLA